MNSSHQSNSNHISLVQIRSGTNSEIFTKFNKSKFLLNILLLSKNTILIIGSSYVNWKIFSKNILCQNTQIYLLRLKGFMGLL